MNFSTNYYTILNDYNNFWEVQNVKNRKKFFFTMEIVGYISKLTGAVQASRENGVSEIWWYGLYMVICAILMSAV